MYKTSLCPHNETSFESDNVKYRSLWKSEELAVIMNTVVATESKLVTIIILEIDIDH